MNTQDKQVIWKTNPIKAVYPQFLFLLFGFKSGVWILPQCRDWCACIAIVRCRDILSVSQPVPESRSHYKGAAVLSSALRRRKCLWSGSQLESIVHQDINCKTDNIALVQSLPLGTHKTDGFISAQPFTSALQLGRNTNKFPTIFAKQFYSCLSEIKAPSLGCALHFYSDWQFFFSTMLHSAFHRVFNAHKNMWHKVNEDECFRV